MSDAVRRARVDAVQLRRREQMRRESLIQQAAAIAPERLVDPVGHVSLDELQQIDAALRLAFALD